MTATVASTAASHVGFDTRAHRVTFPRVLASEAIKFVTLRSPWWSIAIVAVITIGMAGLIAGISTSENVGFANPVLMAVMPMQFVMLVATILGALAVTGEYSSGAERSTFAAVPRRGAVLIARSIVVGAFVAVASLLTFLAAAFVASAITGTAIDWAAADASTLILLKGAAVMGLFALIGVGFGFILRSTGGAIGAAIGLIFVASIATAMLVNLAGIEWLSYVDAIIPSNAAAGVMMEYPGVLTVGQQWLVLLGWPTLLLAAGWLTLRSRDA